MRIVHLLKHAQPGNGHVHVAVDLACAQADEGHCVVFASTRNHFDDVLQRHGVQVVDFTQALGPVSALRCTAELVALGLRFRPQVMHAHMMSSAVVASLVVRLLRTRLVTTVHNSFDNHSQLMRLGDVVVAVSEVERDKLLSQGFVRSRTVTVLNGALGSPRRDIPKDDIGELRTPAIITLSGLHPRKGVDTVVRAFGEVREGFPDWHLNIVGNGPARADLESLVEKLGLEGSVHFLGGTLTPEYLLNQARIFVTCSLADPCPLAVTEARGAGCAIVGTAVDGIPELLDHGRAGLLVPPSDVAATASALRTLMGDPHALQRARLSSSRDTDRFSVGRVAADYEAVYQRALAIRARYWGLPREIAGLAYRAYRRRRSTSASHDGTTSMARHQPRINTRTKRVSLPGHPGDTTESTN